MGGPLPPLQRHLAVNIVPGGSGMGPWHSTISPLRAGVAFVDNLKKKKYNQIFGTILLISSTPLKIIPTDRDKYFLYLCDVCYTNSSNWSKTVLPCSCTKSACTYMQKIQTDSLKDHPAVGRFELLWPKIPKTQSNPTFITVARNVLEIPNLFS